MVERYLNAEIENYRLESAISDEQSPNRRNGYRKKRIKGEFGEAEIQIPRDRNSDFEPILVPNGQSRITGLDDKILSLYARGMTTWDIQDQIKDLYGVEISHALISQITEAVEEERKQWQNHLLDPLYPIVYLDAIVAKMVELSTRPSI